MADFTVKPLGGGDYTRIQEAIDDTTNVVAGSNVYCYANGSTPDETLSVQIDVDGNSGTVSSYINFIGVNSSGVEDGTKYWIYGDNSAVNCLYFGSIDYQTWRNFKLSGATGTYQLDFFVSGASYCHLFNLHIIGAMRLYRNGGGQLWFSLIENGHNGVYNLSGDMYFCTVRNHSSKGINCSYYSATIYGCLIYGCPFGVDASMNKTKVLNNTIYECTKGVDIDLDFGDAILGNRIVGCPTGIDAGSSPTVIAYNYLDNTTDTTEDTAVILVKNAVGIATNTIGGTDIDGGFNDPTNGDFNLTATATMRDVSITLPE